MQRSSLLAQRGSQMSLVLNFHAQSNRTFGLHVGDNDKWHNTNEEYDRWVLRQICSIVVVVRGSEIL